MAHGVLHPGLPERSPSGAPETPGRGKDTRSPLGDRATFSSAGRALAAAHAEPSRIEADAGPDRLAAIREQILQGSYNSLEVVEEVARRLLAAGDV